MLSPSERKIIEKIKQKENEDVKDCLELTKKELDVKSMIAVMLFKFASEISLSKKISIQRIFELMEEHLKNR